MSDSTNYIGMAPNKFTPIGQALRRSRLQHALRLSALQQCSYVAISTISAVERGQRVPSLSVVDAITRGLGETIGTFDLPYLASATDVSQRELVYQRLVKASPPSWVPMQAILRERIGPLSTTKSGDSSRHDRHMRLLLADATARRRQWRRAILIWECGVLVEGENLEPEYEARALSLVGKCRLHLHQPDMALEPLLEASKLSHAGADWESALTNLGLAWWEVGRYEQARTSWTAAVERVTNDQRRATALMGLGNVALRAGQPDHAIPFFRDAYQLYETWKAPNDLCARAVNNLLVASIRSGDEDVAKGAFGHADRLAAVVQNPLVLGELYETMAEWLATQGEVSAACTLIDKAKELLGDNLVLSWFSARLLELELAIHSPDQVAQMLCEIDLMLEQLHDAQLCAAIRLRMVRWAVRRQDLDSADNLLAKCLTIFPPIGGALSKS